MSLYVNAGERSSCVRYFEAQEHKIRRLLGQSPEQKEVRAREMAALKAFDASRPVTRRKKPGIAGRPKKDASATIFRGTQESIALKEKAFALVRGGLSLTQAALKLGFSDISGLLWHIPKSERPSRSRVLKPVSYAELRAARERVNAGLCSMTAAGRSLGISHCVFVAKLQKMDKGELT